MRALLYRIGRRGVILLYLAVVAVLQSWVMIQPVDSHTSALLRFADTILPLSAWATLWGVAGIVAGVNAFRLRDGAGFAATGAMSILWGLVALGGYLTGEVHWGYRPAAIWLGVAGMTLVVATWPEHVEGRD